MLDKSTPVSSGISFQDILLALFKHKWKIIICTIIGLAAAGVFFIRYVPPYQSHAKLLVRYVVDSAPVDPGESAARAPRTMDSIINSEVEILTSWDLALQVAKDEKLKKLASDPTEAAARIQSGLTVTPRKGTNVILASYQDRDPALVRDVLSSLVTAYFTKHLAVHRAGDPVSAQLQWGTVKKKLNDSEELLDKEKAAAGIISLDEGAASLTSELARSQQELRTAEAEFEEQKARVDVLGGALPVPAAESSKGAAAPSPNAEPSSPQRAATEAPRASPADIEQYQMLMGQLTPLRQTEAALGSKFTSENSSVKATREQIQKIERQRNALLEKFPHLIASAPSGNASQPRQFDLAVEQARLVGLEAKKKQLEAQVADVQERFKKFGLKASEIARLDRDKHVNEESYKYASAQVERAKIDAALNQNPNNIPNISEVQDPSPVARETTTRNQVVGALAGGGLGFGIAIALLLELFLNRTIKRPLELPSRLHIPLMLAIPRISRNGSRRLQSGKAGANGRTGTKLSVAPWDHSHFIRRYSEVVRDRLAMFFELNGLVHKPKLIGVAGFSEGAGASTLAGGLAASLSETGDGKVLLVDLNIGQGEAHSFFKGRPAYPLATAIESSSGLDSAAENLYLATVNQEDGAPMSLGLRKFHTMLSGFKASEYDYIIFDMPPLGQMSPTMTLAAHMDKMLLVVESEKNDRDVVKRRHSELIASQAKVSVIFNKARHYGPRWLEAEA